MDFATLAQVKLRLNIKPLEVDDDPLLTELLESTTGAFITRMSRDPRETVYDLERYNGTGGTRLMLRQNPITAVSFLSVDGIEIPAAATSQDAGFLFDNLELYFSSLVGRSPSPTAGANFSPTSRFTSGSQNVIVSYTAGNIPASSIIRDLANAQVWQVSYEFRMVQRIGESAQNLGGGQSNTYQVDEFLPNVLGTLKRHELKAPVA